MTVSDVEQIARVVHKREDIFDTHGDSLINAARTVPPDAFRECATSWRSMADDHIGTIDDPFDRSRDELPLSPTTGGLGLTGWFHTNAGIDILNLIAYLAGGPTNIANLVLVCRRRHQMIHRGWNLHQDTAGTWHFGPTQEPGPPTVSVACTWPDRFARR